MRTIPTCRRCGKAIVLNAENAATFETMHWLCFHLEYEHSADPDAPCGDPSCPWRAIKIYREALAKLGRDPDEVFAQAIEDGFGET